MHVEHVVVSINIAHILLGVLISGAVCTLFYVVRTLNSVLLNEVSPFSGVSLWTDSTNSASGSNFHDTC